MNRALLFAVATLAACGSSVPDKGKNSDFNSSANSSTTTNTGPNNTTTAPNNATTSPNNTTTNPNNATVSANNSTTPVNNTNPTCEFDPMFFGQIGGSDSHGGGVPTPAMLTSSAGLAAVLSATPSEPDDPTTVDVDEGRAVLNTPLRVEGATVTATGPQLAGNRRFWLEDSDTTIQVFLALELAADVRVGQKVSFDVFALRNFEGQAQIAELSDFVVLSEGNPVPYRDAQNRAPTANDLGHIVRITGTVGTGYDCGGTNCYDLTYPGGRTTVRSKSAIVLPGSCVKFAGPLYSFPGPRQSRTTPTLQLDTINFDWMRVD